MPEVQETCSFTLLGDNAAENQETSLELSKASLLDFTDNQITHIAQKDLEHLEKLQKVYLKGNPFHCACNLEWLRIKLHSSPTFIQDGGKIECATPLKFQSKALKSLSNLCGTGTLTFNNTVIIIDRNIDIYDMDFQVENSRTAI
ncbi:hypothetical protein ACROYT_G039906 [Oculina patagonica]